MWSHDISDLAETRALQTSCFFLWTCAQFHPAFFKVSASPGTSDFLVMCLEILLGVMFACVGDHLRGSASTQQPGWNQCVYKPCSPEPCTGGPHTSQQHCITGCAQTSFKLPVWWISFFAVWEICSTLCESTEDLCSFLFLLEASYRALEKHFISASALYLRGNTGIFPAGSIWLFWKKDVGLLASKSPVWKVAGNYHCSMDK